MVHCFLAYDGPEFFDNQNYVTTRIHIQQATTDETKTENTDSEDDVQTIRMGNTCLSVALI